jgi:hypothetical protein
MGGYLFKEILQAKLVYRGLQTIPEKTFITDIQEKELTQEWDDMLAHPIGLLESTRIYLDKLPKILEWLKRG